ncbi:MAG: filamentous hemagglutinin N-terminal domain-containing protein [Pseudomonadota bacterium]
MTSALHPSHLKSGQGHARFASSFVLKALPSALMLVFANAGWAADPTINVGGAAGLPLNGSVAAGLATGNVSGNQLTVTQTTARAVIDWSSFNIGAGKSVHFAQPAAGAVLNRVSAATNASQISGALSADGMVMLMNPHGVLFNQGSSVNVGALIATTGTIDENTFTNTSAQITGASAGIISNQGNITVTAGASGLVALVAPSVINRGVITATGGSVALQGSSAATISLNGGLYEFAIPGGATGIEVTNAAGATLNARTLQLGVGDAANLLSGVINLEGVQQATHAIVVSGHAVELKSALQAPGVSGSSDIVNVSSGARIQDAVKIAKTGVPGAGGTVNVGAGTYSEQVVLNKANMTLKGFHGANISVQEGQTGVDITANGVTLEGMQITGPNSQNFGAINWTGLSTTGVKLASGVSGATIHNNTIKNLRSGIQVTHAAAAITGNTIENTKGAILVRSNNVTMSGNARGVSGNEWDIVFLDGVANGSYFVSPHVSEAQYGAGVMALSVANGDMQILDRRYGVNGLLGSTPQFGNRSHAAVSSGADFTAADDFNLGNGLGNVRQPLATIQAGMNAVVTGGTVTIGGGTYAENINITKALTLDGAGMGQTVLKASTGSGTAVTVDGASGVTLSDLSIADSGNGLLIRNTSSNLTLHRVAFNNNRSGIRTEDRARADNFRMLNSTITGGEIGVQTYSRAGATGSFANALFENVTVDGPSFKGFYFETADKLTLRNVTITNAGNYGAPATSSDHRKYGSAIDINLKYDDFNAITLQNVVVRDSGHSSGNATRAAVVIKTRGIPGDSSSYVAAPASLQSVNIIGGSIEGSSGTGLRIETLSNGRGGQPAVSISGGTQFRNNAQDIVVDRTHVDARGAVFVGAADGFAVEDRVNHALDHANRGLVTWTAGNVYVTQTSGSIQRGVDAAGIGDTVNVANASFVEDVTVSTRRGLAFNNTRLQSLTLGSGASGSGIGGSVTAGGSGGFVFNAPVHLLADTTLATMGADITFNGDVQNAGSVARGLRLIAGTGATRGNVHMTTGGSAAGPLGYFDVSANSFSLASTLWVGAYKIDALGNVTLSNSTLRAQDGNAASSLNAGGDVTGSTISQGSVAVVSAGDIQANIAGTDVVAQAQGAMEVVVTASQSATLTADTIVATITAADVVASSQGDMNVVVAASGSASLSGDSVVAHVTAPVVAVEAVNDAQISGAASQITLDAPRGSVSGSFTQVNNTGGGLVNVNGKPQANQTVSSNAENNRVIPVSGVQDSGAEGGAVQVAQTGDLTRQGESDISLSTPEAAGEALDSGRSIELDMSPRKPGTQNKKTDRQEKEQGE